MYTLCITEKTAKQQHVFEQTFLQMLLETHYDEITISELCRRANLSRKIFYRLFDKKADVLHSLIDHTITESEFFTPDESVGPGDAHQFFAFWKANPALLDALLKHQNSHMLTDRAIRFAMQEEGSPVRKFGKEEFKGSPEIIAFYMSGIFSLLLHWHAQGFDRSIDELSALLTNILTSPAIKSWDDYYNNHSSV